LDQRFKGSILVGLGFRGDGLPLILTGKAAVRMNLGREREGDRGPRLKEKRRSLKLASHVMKKAVIPVGRVEERESGRREWRVKTGRRKSSLSLPLGILEEVK